ncbi:MAG: hypothetical protein JSU86_19685, partial [Phycisphaerales bacterium]
VTYCRCLAQYRAAFEGNSVKGCILVRYRQHREGIPVFWSDLRLLVRNEPISSLVLTACNLRDLGDFVPVPGPALFDLPESAVAGPEELADSECHGFGRRGRPRHDT